MNEPIRPSNVSTPTTLGQRVSTTRWMRGMTVAELAKQVGTNIPTLVCIEADEAGEPPEFVLKALATALSVDFRWLWHGWTPGKPTSLAEVAERRAEVAETCAKTLQEFAVALDFTDKQLAVLLCRLTKLRNAMIETKHDCRLAGDAEGEGRMKALIQQSDALCARLHRVLA